MARYFKVLVNYFSASVEEVFKPLNNYDALAAIDGVSCYYSISKDCDGALKNYFGRGMTELQYHAKNMSKTGFVAWQVVHKRPYRKTSKKAAIKAKMKELL